MKDADSFTAPDFVNHTPPWL